MLPKRQGNHKYIPKAKYYHGGQLPKFHTGGAPHEHEFNPYRKNAFGFNSFELQDPTDPDAFSFSDPAITGSVDEVDTNEEPSKFEKFTKRAGQFLDKQGGNIAALSMFNANRRDISNMPIRQTYQMVTPAYEDVTDRSGQAVNEARRQARMSRLMGAQSGLNAANIDNISAVTAAQAANQIGQIRTQENLRQDQIRGRNVDRGNQANMMNTGIYNQMEGDALSNQYLKQQNTINNRNALVQSILGNEFQRKNRAMQEDALRLTLALEGGRGTHRVLQNIKFNDPALNEGIQSYQKYGGPINYKTNY